MELRVGGKGSRQERGAEPQVVQLPLGFVGEGSLRRVAAQGPHLPLPSPQDQVSSPWQHE